MSAADARRELGTLLQTAFPVWQVLDPKGSVEDIRKPALVLYRTEAAKLPSAPLGHMQDTYALMLAVPVDTPEDDLDDYLDELLTFLDEGSQTRWTVAERDVFANLPAYKVTLTTSSRRSS